MIERLKKAIGSEKVLSPPPKPWDEIDGIKPKVIVYPSNETEISEILRICSENNWTVIPSGTGHALNIGPRILSADIILCTKKLNKITYFEPEDLVISAEAGMLFKDLLKEIEPFGLDFNVVHPIAEKGTIGGIGALGKSSATRMKLGNLRDNILGVKGVLSDGMIFSSGGRVVKNVAGYDLSKIIIGSMGTYGIITEMTLRLKPKPKTDLSIISTKKKWIWPALEKAWEIKNKNIDPLCIGVYGSPFDSRIAVRIAGEEIDVAKRKDLILKILPQDAEQRLGTVFNEFEEFPWLNFEKDKSILVRVYALPTEIKNLAKTFPENSAFFLDLISGCAELSMDPKEFDAFKKQAEELGGNLLIVAGPPNFRDFKTSALFTSKGEENLSIGLKKSLDPRGILSPGRMGK